MWPVGPSTVSDDVVSDDIAGARGTEESDGVCDLFGLSHSAEWNLSGSFCEVLRIVGSHFAPYAVCRIDRAGGNHVGSYAIFN